MREEMYGMRERYERSFRWRVSDKLDEGRAEFCTKIYASINETKSCKLYLKKDTEEILRGR